MRRALLTARSAMLPASWIMVGGAAPSDVFANDGSTFTTVPDVFAGDSAAIEYSPALSRWVAVDYLGHAAYSPDGITWTAAATTLNGGGGGSTLRWIPFLNLFVYGGLASNVAAIWTSPDGITWTSRGTPFGAATGWGTFEGVRGFAASGTVVVAGGDSGHLATSPDGITWTGRTGGLQSGSTGAKVARSSSLFVAVAGTSSSGNTCATSPDGITWTGRGRPLGNAIAHDYVAWSPALGLFVIASGGSGGQLATSADGITWILRTSNMTSIRALTWAPLAAKFILTSSAGGLYATSDDGITWTTATAPGGSLDYRSVAGR